MKVPGKEIPVSKLEGAPAAIRLVNTLGKPVRVYWVDAKGEWQKLADVKPNAYCDQRIPKGAVWLVTDTADKPLGYFVGAGEPSRAVIRK